MTAAPAGPFTLLPHTADMRVSVHGASLDALYDAAAAAVRHLLVGESLVAEREERRLDMAAVEEPAERFFRFVRELLYLYDAEGFLPARVLTASPARVLGERFDPIRHAAERQLKAVTRHGFELRKEGEGYRAELLFDI